MTNLENIRFYKPENWQQRLQTLQYLISEVQAVTFDNMREMRQLEDKQWWDDHEAKIRENANQFLQSTQVTEAQKEKVYRRLENIASWGYDTRRAFSLYRTVGTTASDSNGLSNLVHYLDQIFFEHRLYERMLTEYETYHTQETVPDDQSPPLLPNQLLNLLISNISTDLEVIQHAHYQRQRNKAGLVTFQGYLLGLADFLSTNALKKAVKARLMQNKYVISYLHRQMNIRLIPYINIFFVGVPFATLPRQGDPSTDYLAIPHEIGHFIYWNGLSRGTTIQEALHDNLMQANILPTDWRLQWLEEIFADIYGCLVAGPISVLGFQELLSDNIDAYETHDRDKHPIPVLRPFIQTQALRKITDQHNAPHYPHAPDILDAHWKQIVGEQVLTDTFTPFGQTPALTGEAILDSLSVIIDQILTVLKATSQGNAYPWTDPWTGDLPANGSIESLYQQFAAQEFVTTDNLVSRQGPPWRKGGMRYWRGYPHLLKLDVLRGYAENGITDVPTADILAQLLVPGWSTEHAYRPTWPKPGTSPVNPASPFRPGRPVPGPSTGNAEKGPIAHSGTGQARPWGVRQTFGRAGRQRGLRR